MAKNTTKTATTKTAAAANPTTAQFAAYQAMYDYLNAKLFGGSLAPVILNFSRKAKTYGFFAPDRWATASSSTHEISLNPSYLATRPARETASTLAHEMAHCWQEEHGKPGRGRYHNEEWAAKMEEIGLMPSDTGEAGGARTGDRMTHYIVDGGAFDRAFAEMPADCLLPWSSFERDSTAKPRKASKVKFTCPCCSANAWAKPAASLMCGECEEHMVSEQPDDGDGDEG